MRSAIAEVASRWCDPNPAWGCERRLHMEANNQADTGEKKSLESQMGNVFKESEHQS